MVAKVEVASAASPDRSPYSCISVFLLVQSFSPLCLFATIPLDIPLSSAPTRNPLSMKTVYAPLLLASAAAAVFATPLERRATNTSSGDGYYSPALGSGTMLTDAYTSPSSGERKASSVYCAFTFVFCAVAESDPILS